MTALFLLSAPSPAGARSKR